jgi:hypothetical protein
MTVCKLIDKLLEGLENYFQESQEGEREYNFRVLMGEDEFEDLPNEELDS